VTAGLITILFTDLVGSTELASQLGDAAADELRREHFASLREAVAATSGTEVKTIGDALMVSYAGAADALAGAVAMQRAVDRHNRRIEGRRLQMRVGISVGDATFEDGDWFGTPVVEASRLCAAATADQILVSDLVRALAGSRTEYDVLALGSRELKGLPAPLEVCEVEWRAPVDATAVPLPVFVDTAPAFPFAGRSEAYETALAAWKESVEGTRRAVLVSGEPGIGKTRLVSELVRHAHDMGAIVLWGRCDEELSVPFEPFAEALRHYVASVPGDRVRAELGSLGGELTRVLPDLAERVPGLAAPVSTDPETERHRLFEAVADFLSEMSHADPVILVLDDIHWADKPSLLMLRHLLRSAAPMRLLVFATYRDTDLDRTHPLSDVLADLRRQSGVDRLDLAGLDPSEVASFMEGAAGHDLDEAGTALGQAIFAETQGNPFFVGEVLRHFVESGALVQRDGRWTSDLTLEEAGIPEGIREVVGRRLSRLSDAANSALAVGAVVGATFDLSTIEAAGGPTGDALFDALDEATRASIVREVPGTVGRYTFAHALVRSALYEELTTNRRVRMHWRIGEALEARHERHLDAHLDELAHQFVEGALAGDPRKAVEYCRRAGEKADAELAFEAAAHHYERALGTLELVADDDPLLRCDLQLARATALNDAGDERRWDAGFAAAASARTIGDADRLARAALILSGNAPVDTTVPVELVALLEDALAAIGDEPSALRARLMIGLAMQLQWGPEVERRMRLARDALALARETRDPDALATVLARGWVLVDGSTPYADELRALHDEAEAVARELGNPAALAEALHYGAFGAAMRGDRALFDEKLDESTRLYDSLRRPLYDWITRLQAIARAEHHGELDKAEQIVNEAAEHGRRADVSAGMILTTLGGDLYQIRRAQGRLDEMVDLLAGLVESTPDIPLMRLILAGAYIETDRVDDARPHYMWLADNDCANVPRDIEYSVTLCGLGRLAYDMRPPAPVVEYMYEQLAPFAGAFNWSGQLVTDANDFGLAMMASMLGRFEAADRHFAAAIALCERAGARANLARCHFTWARVLADRGDAPDAREHAEIAVALGDELGMTGQFGIVARGRALLESL
jgi:class 3 adenylate cyclase/tetratricopeptide (TPR) repeat protein